MRWSTLKTLVVVGLSASLLAGCGFQLRGGAKLEGVDAVRVEAANTTTRDILGVFLTDGGVQVVKDPKAPADAVLTVANERYDRRVLTIDPNTGKAREYELAYSAQFGLVDSEGKPMVRRQTLQLKRDFVFDADAVIGKSREEGVLREEMRRDGIQQIIRRLRALLKQ
ncbi:MAG: LPS assembly lipoprotein LptE [Pseudomonadota bacterium]